MAKPDFRKALFLAKRNLAQIVTDVVSLEDINFTVPEVQTLMDGITIGGHKIQEELITLNQIKAWQFLFQSLADKSFTISLDYICQLHKIVAKEEALEWGKFRRGNVRISGTEYIPPNANELNNLWLDLEQKINHQLNSINNLNDNTFALKTRLLYDAAIELFLTLARHKFFYNGNKRTARMMMSGLLISYGYPMISIPAKFKQEYNKLMIDYYNTEQIKPMYNFMINLLDDYILEEFELVLSTYS